MKERKAMGFGFQLLGVVSFFVIHAVYFFRGLRRFSLMETATRTRLAETETA